MSDMNKKEYQESEIIHNNNSLNIINIIKYPVFVLMYLNAFITFIYSIKLAGELFKYSFGVALVLFLTGFGLIIYGIPTAISIVGPSIILDWSEQSKNYWELYTKFILGLIFVFILTNLSYFLLLLIQNFLIN